MLSKQRELPSFSHRGGKASPVRRSISYSVTPGDQPWLEALLSSVPEVSAQPNHTQALSCTNSLNKQYTFFIYFCRKRVRYFSGRTNYGTVVCVLTYINTQGYHFSGKYIKKKKAFKYTKINVAKLYCPFHMPASGRNSSPNEQTATHQLPTATSRRMAGGTRGVTSSV